jgi:cbb3-type cytochrome c oxidase subunit III
MTRRIVRLAVPALVLLPAVPALIGGWAVTTVEHLPDYAVAGRPLTLAFTVRQHGFRPIDGLRPQVEVLGGESRRYEAVSDPRVSGRYTASITLPRAADWIITIHSGFGTSRTTLMPLRAIASGSPAPPSPSGAEQGRRLFAAKGCFTCHVEMRAGPELFAKRYTTEYVAQVLTDPGRVFAGRQGAVSMPNLNLEAREIAAIAAYLSANKGLAASR